MIEHRILNLGGAFRLQVRRSFAGMAWRWKDYGRWDATIGFTPREHPSIEDLTEHSARVLKPDEIVPVIKAVRIAA